MCFFGINIRHETLSASNCMSRKEQNSLFLTFLNITLLLVAGRVILVCQSQNIKLLYNTSAKKTTTIDGTDPIQYWYRGSDTDVIQSWDIELTSPIHKEIQLDPISVFCIVN